MRWINRAAVALSDSLTENAGVCIADDNSTSTSFTGSVLGLSNSLHECFLDSPGFSWVGLLEVAPVLRSFCF